MDGVISTPQPYKGLRLDMLVSYEPTPGKAVYFGYGSTMEPERMFGSSDLRRVTDGFFLKLAYMFRR